MEKIVIPDLTLASFDMWVKYLTETGHTDALKYMLGIVDWSEK